MSISNEKIRRIIAVTGARSEYDALFPILKQLSTDASFDVQVLVSGSHLSEIYGKTIKFIEADGFKIADKVYNLINTDEKIGRAISLGNQIQGFAQTFDRLKPDIVIVIGDREEALSTCITTAYMGIASAHVFGGDVTKDGNIDNSVRYATSKLANIHFTGHPQHSENLIKMGEDPWRIFTVGNPAIDRLLSVPQLSREELSTALKVSVQEPYLLLIYHPIISNIENEGSNIKIILEAILDSGLKCFVNSPNSDAGNFSIIEVYREYTKKYPNLFTTFQNLDRNIYVNLMRHACALIGNSSSGILEAPSFGLPAINIGPRQRGRAASNNVVFLDYNKEEIIRTISFILEDRVFRESIKETPNPYGDGNSAQKIAEVLKKVRIDEKLIYKNITY